MFRFKKRHARCFFALSALLAVTACSHSFAVFWDEQTRRFPTKASQSPTTEVRFFGVSSLLIRSGASSVMIDGFLTRPDHALTTPVQPNIATVTSLLSQANVALPRPCKGNSDNAADIDAVIAMHGHYDHALDTPLVAALTGATLIADDEVLALAVKTRQAFPSLCPIKDLREIERSKSPIRIPIGEITLTLFEMPHSTNLASTLLEALPTERDWDFPTSIRNMKAGTSLAAHVKTRNGSILIVPTAGKIGNRLAAIGLKADTIFLGVGGLGWQSHDQITQYLLDTVLASGATTVVPIHWDGHAPALDPTAPVLPIPVYENLDRVLRALEALSKDHPHISVLSVPTFYPFDPFHNITARKLN